MFCTLESFILIIKVLRNLRSRKLIQLQFIIQDLSRLKLIIASQEATTHWFIFTTEYLKENTDDFMIVSEKLPKSMSTHSSVTSISVRPFQNV